MKKELKTRKIVINGCFGGFNLSDEAFEMYLKLKGVKFYKYKGDFLGSNYYAVPKEKYDKFKRKWYQEDGNYKRINKTNWFLSYRDIKRDDKDLVKVVETLGEKANNKVSKLKIVEIPIDVEWEIEEYDGLESVHEKHRSWQ